MRLTITMSDAEFARLKVEAERLGVKMAHVVREALEQRLAESVPASAEASS